jgi:hypothetical protein
MVAETPDGRFEHYGLSDYADTIPATRDRWTTVLGSFRYPCWLDRSGRGHLEPLKGLGHSWSPDRARQVGFQGPVLIYPLKRARSTPLDQFTVVDLVRATLGVGPCQYILDVEGQGSHYEGMATCGARDALGEIYRNHQQKQKRAEIEKVLQQVVVFVKHIRGRIEDYVAFAHDLTSYLDQQQEKHPELAAWLGEMRSLTAKVDEHVAARKESIKTPQYVIDLTGKFRLTVMDYEGADALEKCEAITNAIVEVGGNQDELVGECRMVVKAIRQRAGLALAVEPRAAEIAREIRDRSHQVLRNPAGHEGARH